ncbi:MAG: hypothetical protein LBH42_00265 [Treponema sp.]|jgi:hypothetical protein|nr:hypothetical protein [Treponema sp.]
MADESPDSKVQPEIEREPVFYYSREHRLSKASPEVRAMNEGKRILPGLSRRLFATRGNVPVFVIIVLFTALGMATRIAGRERNLDVKLGGNSLAMVIFSEDEVLILGMSKKAPSSGEFFTGEVDITVLPIAPKSKDPEDSIKAFNHRFFFRPIESETFQISLPFDTSDFFVVLKAGEEQKTIRLKVVETRR